MPKFTFIAVSILAMLWGIKYLFSKDSFDAVLSLFFIVVFFVRGLEYAYPILVNLALSIIFLYSLKTTPMITKFALLKEPGLDKHGLNYTRNLTILWIGFFIINALISFVLAMFDDKTAWAIYCGVISYILIALFIVGEMIYRRKFIKNVKKI